RLSHADRRPACERLRAAGPGARLHEYPGVRFRGGAGIRGEDVPERHDQRARGALRRVAPRRPAARGGADGARVAAGSLPSRRLGADRGIHDLALSGARQPACGGDARGGSHRGRCRHRSADEPRLRREAGMGRGAQPRTRAGLARGVAGHRARRERIGNEGDRMIIDCHGHYTTAPAAHQRFREAQTARLKDGGLPPAKPAQVSDDEIRESIEANQLKLQRERGSDLTLFSPRASAMGHHLGDEEVSAAWTGANNDLIKRVVDLYPDNFAGVCQLPQSPGVPIANSIHELERCILELGFVGCNLNPDPSGGHWTSPPLTDRHWYPFYEKMAELQVPAMVHVSASCNPCFHATGAHYINADTTAFMQFIQG